MKVDTHKSVGVYFFRFALWMRGTDPFARRYCILLGLLFIIESDSIHIIALTCVRSQIEHEVSMCS